jgi:hypothetical protein
MGTVVWRGGAKQVPQVNTVTPANVAATNTFTVTVNGKSFTYAAAGATVAEVTAGLVALLSASSEPDVAELTIADLSTAVRITGPADGTPFTQTSSAAGGTATLTTATATAASGPNDWSVPANWNTGAVPVAADDVIVDNSDVPIKYGLDQHTVTLTSLTIGPGFTGTIGLPERNPAGYAEYRPTYLKVGATSVRIGGSDQQAGGSGRVKLDNGTVQADVLVMSAGSPADSGLPAVLWKGTHAANTVEVVGGTVGLAALPGETATVATLKVGGGAGQLTLAGGAGLTLTTLKQVGGAVTLGAGVTTVTKNGGTLTVLSGACTTLTNDGGEVFWQSTGSIGTIDGAGVFDFSRDPRARTVTNATFRDGAKLSDPLGSVTWSNPFVATPAKVSIDVGVRRNIQVT